MYMQQYKLVRDHIPEIMERNGQTPVYYTAGEEEYTRALDTKLTEEVGEFIETHTLEELADVQEVLDTLVLHYGWSKDLLVACQAKKRQERGGFQERSMLKIR